MKAIRSSLTKYSVALALTLGCVLPASATLITQTQILVSDGQNFIFDFNGLGLSDGTDGVLTIASGTATNPSFSGLDLDAANEFFDVVFETTNLGRFGCNSGTGVTTIPGNTGGIECDFSLDIAIDGASLLSLLADGMLSIGVNFSDTVNAFNDNDEVIVSISYVDANGAQPVPEPSALAIFALGLLGLASRRFKKNA